MHNKGLNIILIEDHPETAASIQQQLLEEGHTAVLVVVSLQDASRVILSQQFDLLVVGMQSRNVLEREIIGQSGAKLFNLPVRLWEPTALQVNRLQSLTEANNSLFAVTTLDSAADGIVVVNGEQKLQYLNSVAQQLTGWSLIEASGQPYRNVLVFESNGEVVTDDHVRLATLNDEPLRLGRNLTLVSRNGQRVQIEAEISAGNASTRSFGAIVFTFRDVTSRVWEEKQQRQEQTIRAVERLAESTAHSLGNLLTRLLGNGDLLLHHAALPPDARDVVVEMNNAAQKVADVVRQLSNISRTTFVSHQEVQLTEVVTTLLARIAERVPPGIKIVTDLDHSLAPISASPAQLEQIVGILVSNALEACGDTGTITISTQNVVVEPTEEAYKAARNFVCVSVKDTGSGIDKDVLPQIFDPFFTTRKSEGHAGLGLSIAQGLIRDYKGFLDVSSRPGEGTETRIGFPAMQADPLAYLDDGDRASPLKTILLVEDDHAVRLLLRKILERNRYRILEARDGEEALFVADLHTGSIDLLLTDVHMPRMMGPELIREFAPTHPETKFLLISGFSPDKVAASSLPPDLRFLQKPFDQKTLLLQIRSLLEE